MSKRHQLRITKRGFLRLVRVSLVSFAGLVILFIILNLLFPLPDKIEYSRVITDSKGEMVNAYLTSDDQWRMRTELSEISPLLQKTIIAKEDRHFYRHPGVNPFAVIRALFNNITGMRRTSGASTITMQVAKALEPGKRNIWNKTREMFRAFQLEFKYSKKEILQMYLNLVPYGGNIQGVKSASILYFKKNPDHLSLAEIVSLSVIPNKPSLLVPGRHNDRIIQERNKWLHRFAREKVFTAVEIEDALNEPLNVSRNTVPHFIPHLSNKLKHSAPKGKWVTQTFIDLNMQAKTEKLVEDYTRVQKLNNIRNAAVVIIDNETNEVITYLGSSDFSDTSDGGQVNGANAIRQPGSTLKPLLYAMCFDEGLLTPKTIITDVPVNYMGYSPENYDRRFNGYVSAEYSLAHSLNIPAVKGLNSLGTEVMINKLSSAGFRQIQKDRRKLGLSLVLGGCGTTLEELTALFAAFANKGIFTAPVFSSDQVKSPSIRLVSEESAFMVTEILSKVNRPDFPVNWSATEKMPKIAWKTGTSYGRKDGWSIGYNKKYTVGVWTGNFSGVGATALSGANTATPLLFRIFNTIDYDSDQEWFDMPDSLSLRKVCSETGLLPADHCTNITSDYFIPLISSTKTCDNRKPVLLSADGKLSYCKGCAPAAGYRTVIMPDISPDMQAWMKENKISYQEIPMHNPDCELIFGGAAPAITSPVNGTEYLVDISNPEPIQLSCKTANDVNRVYWYINDRFYKSSSAGDKQFFVPREGRNKISCTDDKGRNREVRISVRRISI